MLVQENWPYLPNSKKIDLFLISHYTVWFHGNSEFQFILYCLMMPRQSFTSWACVVNAAAALTAALTTPVALAARARRARPVPVL